jgi:tryptophanyl-tRNA synthetase
MRFKRLYRLQHLGVIGQSKSNLLVGHIPDSVVLAHEHISQDPEGTSGGGDVQSHQTQQTQLTIGDQVVSRGEGIDIAVNGEVKVVGTNSDQTVRCLIPCAIDQDPYFRMTRDVAPRLGFLKPALIHSKFFPALQGHNTKMSASSETSAIYLTDTPDMIKKKINTHAFSGGRATVEEHRKLGADLSVDVPMEYLSFFMDDEPRLESIRAAYAKGELLTGEVKGILIDVLIDLVTRHQRARAKVSEDVVDAFLATRRLDA